MTTLTTVSVDQAQTRVDPGEARDALSRVLGADAVSAVARLRYGPGRTCEPIARLVDSAVARARATGLDPSRLVVTAGEVRPGDDIVRVRRKAHGKADWITTVTSDIVIELTPAGLEHVSRHQAATPPLPPNYQAGPRRGQADHPLVPEIRQRLYDVIDPDLGINIVDLGFVRAIAVDGRTALLTMTLTSAACPLTGVMADQIRKELLTDDPTSLVDDFHLDWEWTPAWTPADISTDGREQLRAIGFTI